MVDLVNERKQVVFGKDSIVIQKFIAGIKGGRALNVADFPLDVIEAGHVIIVKDGEYKPMPVQESEGNYTYGSLPAGHAYAGILVASISKDRPAASIMTIGQVNEAALPIAITTIKSAFTAACPHIEFIKDEESI